MESIRFDPSDGSSPAEREPGRRPVEDVAHRGAWRLTFGRERSRVELVLIEAIDMVVPPSLPSSSQPPGSPFWFEVQDDRGAALYRRAQLHHPIHPTVEVWTGELERPVMNVPFGMDAGEFTLLVPSLPQARAVALFEWARPVDADQSDDSPAPSTIARFAIGRGIDPEAIARDQIPPRTVSDALATYHGVATIHLRASDNTGPVASTHHVLDDGEPQQRLTVTTRELGEHTLRFWSVDRAGNVERENLVTFGVVRRVRRATA